MKINSKGFSICFIGADGAGKTTISAEIQKWLSENSNCKKVYLGSNDQYKSLYKSFKKVTTLGKSNKLLNTQKFNAKTSVLKHNIKEGEFKQNIREYIVFLFNILYGMDLLKVSKRSLKKLKEAEKYKKKGGIVIFDRFPQVQFVGIYDGPKIRDKFPEYSNKLVFKVLASREEKVLEKATHLSPTLVFKLHLPPEVSISRKPDHSFENIKIKAEITEKLVFNKSKTYNIDATQPYDNELNEIKKIITEEIINLNK